MLALVLGAIRRRRAQAVLLLILGAIAAAAASAAPGYILASNERLAADGVNEATPAERLVRSYTSTQIGSGGPAEAAATLDKIRSAIVLPGFRQVTDVRVAGALKSEPVALADRQDVCDHVVVQGGCDIASGHVIIDSVFAEVIHAKVGDKIPFATAAGGTPLPLTVTGIYTRRDPDSEYWIPIAGSRVPTAFTDPSFIGDPRFAKLQMTVSLDQVATADAFRQTDPQFLALDYEVGANRLAATAIASGSGLRALANRIWLDQQFVYAGVWMGVAHLLILSWLALFLAVRLTSRSRRPDVALVKMRGGRRRDLWLLVAGQSALPMLVGGGIGLAVGLRAGGLLAGPTVGAAQQQVQGAALAAAGVAVLGAVAAALVAEGRMLTEPVTELSRGVPSRRRVWLGRAIDAVAVILAAVTAYEVTSGTLSHSAPRGVGLLAPIVVALAAGLVLARLVPFAANAIAVPALRAGHLSIGLASVHLARRRTMAGAITMTVLAISVLGGAAIAWDTSTRARADRASADVGADRVLTVAAPSRTALLDAVRAADPTGRYAMAALEAGGVQPVLAVDSSRLAAVASPAPYFDGSWADIARTLHPTATAAPVSVNGTGLSVDVTFHLVEVDLDPTSATPGNDAAPDAGATPGGTVVETAPPGIRAYVDLVNDAGGVQRALFGPLTAGRATYSTAVNCAAGCHVVSVGMVNSVLDELPQPPVGTQLVVHALNQRAPDRAVLGPKDLADRTAWRTDVAPITELPILAKVTDGLALTVGPSTYALEPNGYAFFDVAAFRLDAPTPLPVLLAGTLPPQLAVGDTRLDAFGYHVPISVSRTATALPRLGTSGNLVDLEYLDRILHDGEIGGTAEVWLTADAPASVADALGRSGVRIISEQSRASRLDSLASQGPTIVLRFLLLAAIAGAVLAVAIFTMVATADRTDRAEEFGALRAQGLAEPVVWRAGAGVYLLFSVAATAVAGLTAVLLRPLLAKVFPVFADPWAVLAPPTWRGFVLWLPVAAVLAIEVGCSLLAGAQLVRAVRRGRRTP